jgi:hypothetical protein
MSSLELMKELSGVGWCRLWMVSKGKLYLLVSHHKYTRPEKEAPRLLVGSDNLPKHIKKEIRGPFNLLYLPNLWT